MTRRAFTLVEVGFFSALGLVLLVLVLGLLRAVHVHDEWTSHELDAIESTVRTADVLRRRALESDRIAPSPGGGLTFWRRGEGDKAWEPRRVTWPAPQSPLKVDGMSLSDARLEGFEVTAGGVKLTCGKPAVRGHSVSVSVPLPAREQSLRKDYPEWSVEPDFPPEP